MGVQNKNYEKRKEKTKGETGRERICRAGGNQQLRSKDLQNTPQILWNQGHTSVSIEFFPRVPHRVQLVLSIWNVGQLSVVRDEELSSQDGPS